MTSRSESSKTSRPKNVILMMTDQHQVGLTAREGFSLDTMPVADRLAQAGVAFPRAYSAAPVCVPSRISMLTGRFPSAHGVLQNYSYGNPDYSTDLFGVFTNAGYRTAMIGKNHSHLTSERVDYWSEYGHLGQLDPKPSDPEHADFDEWLRDLGFRTADQPTPFPASAQLPARIIDEAIEWLGAGEDPALMWLSFPEPHVPYQVCEPYFSQFPVEDIPLPDTTSDSIPDRPAWKHVEGLGQLSGELGDGALEARARYVAMLKLIDDQIARLVDHLEASGELEDTLFVFMADHGDFVGEYGLMRKGPELPEVLIRVPLWFSGVGVSSDTDSDLHVSLVDIFPTLCTLIGAEIPSGVQGRSLIEELASGASVPPAEFDSIYAEQGVGGPHPDDRGDAAGDTDMRGIDTLSPETQSGMMRMVRSGRWKLVMDMVGNGYLYDLENDPRELENLIDRPELGEVALRLTRRLAQWQMRASDPMSTPDDGYPRSDHPLNYLWI